jgi:uncharacterized membrane protein
MPDASRATTGPEFEPPWLQALWYPVALFAYVISPHLAAATGWNRYLLLWVLCSFGLILQNLLRSRLSNSPPGYWLIERTVILSAGIALVLLIAFLARRLFS